MSLFLIFIITFLVVYVLYLLLVIFNKKKVDNIFETNQAKLIIKCGNLDVSKINKKGFANVISLSNSFIVAFTMMISEFFDNYFIKLIVCFLILILSILLVYRLIGLFYNGGK